MTSGNKSSTSFKLSDVVGQTAAGVFTSKGYIIQSGFLNSAAGEVFSFSVSPTVIDFGLLTPRNPVEKTILIAIANGNTPGYVVKASENQPLSTTLGSEIVDTACDKSETPCHQNTATLWTSRTTYGFGYRMTGKTVSQDFLKDDFFRPFPASKRNEPAIIIMQSQAKQVTDQATMKLKVNVNQNQPVGRYRNVITFQALLGI